MSYTPNEVVEVVTREVKRIGEQTDKVNKRIESLPEELKDVIGLKSELHNRMDAIETAFKRGGGSVEFKAETSEEREYKSAFQNFVRTGETGNLKAMQQKALSSGFDPDGGYLVPSQLSTRVIEKVFEVSPIRQVANVQTASSSEIDFPVDADEAEAQWVDETSPRRQTNTPQLGKKKIVVHELSAIPQATERMLEDSAVDVDSWLTKKLANKFARTEGRAFVLGTGRGQPVGFLTYAASPEGGAVQRIMSGKADGFPDGSGTADALMEMIYSLKAAYRQNASWLMPRSTQLLVRLMKDDRGNYLWQPGIKDGQPGTLLGYSVRDAEDMPQMAAGSLSIAFGDWHEAYTIVDRIGMTIRRDPFTADPFVKFIARKRVGGDVVNPEAFALLKTGPKA
ncbi:phage major capsid protein [Methylobacterium sp. NEAU 140]|uniref:phage major capsid protein n=1 Tax=Methylobacterium sp. NEAU 140 TaxID=3064945 RepID=UPI0027343D87|nr:phage major capsid protein [Methylobacterium sp. NEAU 140]MDP4027017.1 phage major capsid protein [Methylobacterium sp. NEAU 140]